MAMRNCAASERFCFVEIGRALHCDSGRPRSERIRHNTNRLTAEPNTESSNIGIRMACICRANRKDGNADAAANDVTPITKRRPLIAMTAVQTL